jgi:hypothetical protein
MKTLACMILKNPHTKFDVHEIWATCKGSPQQAESGRIRAKVLIGRYGLNVNRSVYRPGIDTNCPNCLSGDEDVTHFVAGCRETRQLVQTHI